MDILIINEQIFKKYDECYYISADGEIYSTYSHRILKHQIDVDGYHRVDLHQRHRKVHQLVYLTWIGAIPEGMQINHYDDNKNNNHYTNLYCGTQKENRNDCVRNKTNVGNTFYLTVFDKETNKTLTFCPAIEFVKYCGHSNRSGSLNKFFSKNWFRKRYQIIEFKRLKTAQELKEKGVTTMEDECTPVE